MTASAHARSSAVQFQPDSPRFAISGRAVFRVACVTAALAVELAIPPHQTARQLEFYHAGGTAYYLVSQIGGRLRYCAIAGGAGAIFFSWKTFREELLDVLAAPSRRLDWILSLIVNVFLAIILIGMVPALTRATSPASPAAWLAMRAVIAVGAVISGSLALMPVSFWRRWYSRSRVAFLCGAVLGLTVYWMAPVAEIVWRSASRPTLWAAAWCLRGLGKAVRVNPQILQLSIPGFSAKISSACSGIEGIGLVVTFLSFYLWWYRDQLRFPRVMILLPIGIVAAWLLNVTRIVALILIGVHNRDLALNGFHSAAGWILFNTLCFGIVGASWYFPSLSKTESVAIPRRSEATVYLVPILVVTATALVTHALSANFDLWYPVRVIAVAVALWVLRDRLLALELSPSFFAVGIGAVVFAIWIAVAKSSPGDNARFITGSRELSPLQSSLWLIFRVIGAAVTVPVAEELAFRGYLLRKLIASDFETVSARKFTWFSFVASSILFGALHQEWIAGTIAGMLFAYAVYRRGSIGDAILAHSTANALLAAYVLATGSWSLWS